MKLRTFLAGIVPVVLALAVTSAVVALAQSAELPNGVQTFELSSGLICIIYDGEFQDCYCPCITEGGCIIPTPWLPPGTPNIPTVTPTVTPTDPTPTPVPTDPIPTPVPTDKPKCNRGVGNGSEDCDPGGSYGQGGGTGRRAGEDRAE